ncbi:MAG: Peptidase T-like protein [Parcubacteria group bacterium GW2011_GWF2_38_76]|nr:MAG: Peptidase T-like protein [Parcubacteria group bacterium GW2011_GWF2_38_76]
MKINHDRLIETFISLVKIDSESGEEKEIINYLQSMMIDLGFDAEIDKTGNLVCSNDSNPRLMLAAHTDTVTPGKGIKPIIDGNIIKTDGTTILGSDDKANVAIILEILQVLKKNDIHAPLNVVFTIGEEVGFTGSTGLDYEKIGAKIGLNLDGEIGEIDIAEPSMMVFDIEITGKAAHSGMAPEKGINALKIAAEAINSLDLGRIDEETTVNVGTIRGGEAVNIIPEKIALKAEVRSRSNEKFNYQVQKLIDVFEKTAKKYGGLFKITSEQTSYAFNVTEDDKLVEVLKNCFTKNGVKPEVLKINAGSDTSNFSRNNIKCVTTGGCGKDYHTTGEYLEIDGFTKAAASILDAILELTK